MVEELRIELPQMMENAGRGLAELVIARFDAADVVVLAGPGGNGGGGLVAARHLSNRGCRVSVVLSDAERMTPVPAHQLDILRRMGLDVGDEPRDTSLVVDALIGYSLRGAPTGRAAELIAWANDSPAVVVSLDTPSGLDVTTGVAATPCIRATATMTLALPKAGLLAAAEVGTLYVADISVPSSVYRRMGIDIGTVFRETPLVELSD